ncbi:beta-microseminoprotein, partial [Panthera uncia]|uniref:beta-microseminoprotein n=1 Tax=Panthera uncia TaxID=29064 RepID=UPI0020FFAEA7
LPSEFIGSPSHLCFTLHNVLLGSLRVLANFVTLCNAQCCVIPNKNTPGGLSNGKSWLLNVYYIIAAWFCFCGPGVGVRVGMCNTASGGADATPQAHWDRQGSKAVALTLELVLGRLGILSFLAGLALVSMTALLQPCIMTKTKCQKIFNKEICSYKVVEQNDPERTCIVL